MHLVLPAVPRALGCCNPSLCWDSWGAAVTPTLCWDSRGTERSGTLFVCSRSSAKRLSSRVWSEHRWPSVSARDNFSTVEDTKTCWWSSPLYKMTVFAYNLHTSSCELRSSLNYLWYLTQYKHYANRCQCGKFTFYFLELSGIFFPNIFDLPLVESVDVEPRDIAGQMYS